MPPRTGPAPRLRARPPAGVDERLRLDPLEQDLLDALLREVDERREALAAPFREAHLEQLGVAVVRPAAGPGDAFLRHLLPHAEPIEGLERRPLDADRARARARGLLGLVEEDV